MNIQIDKTKNAPIYIQIKEGMQIINSNAKDYPKITKIAPELDIN
jgi:hypothetical protein